MLLTRLFHFLGGYLVITISGRYPERFLNVCAKRGILIWDVFPCSEQVLRCSISIRGFRLLPPITKKTGVHIKIIKKHGLPFLLSRYKKRKLFLVGLILFVVFLTVINQFIWKIEIKGCETLTKAAVMDGLSECGLRIGSFRPFLNEQKLKNDMLIKMPELAWIWADKSGSKIIVEIKERVQKPEIFDADAFCNLVATKDGVIESMIVKKGTPMVALGDTVQKGDILVSGLWVSDKGVPPRTVHSDGEIYARTWYEKTKAYSLYSPAKKETGKIEKKYTLHVLNQKINLFRNPACSFSEFSSSSQDKEFSLFGFYLGVSLHCEIYKELETEWELLSSESVAQNGKLELEKEIDEMTFPNSERQNSQATYEVIDAETIEVTVVAEYIENIAEKVAVSAS